MSTQDGFVSIASQYLDCFDVVDVPVVETRAFCFEQNSGLGKKVFLSARQAQLQSLQKLTKEQISAPS